MCGLLMRHFRPRARMVFVRSDPNRECGLASPPPFAGFSDPVLSTRLPLPLSDVLPATLQLGPPQLAPVRAAELSAPTISSLASCGFRVQPMLLCSTDLTRNPTLQPQRPLSLPVPCNSPPSPSWPR